jgi:hypothetical protein
LKDFKMIAMDGQAEREALFAMLRAQADEALQLVMAQSARQGDREPFLPVLTPSVAPRSAAPGAEALAAPEGAWTQPPVMRASTWGITLRTDIGLALQELVYLPRDEPALWTLPKPVDGSSALPAPISGRNPSTFDLIADDRRTSVEARPGPVLMSRHAPSALPHGIGSDAGAFHADPAFLDRFATVIDSAISRYARSVKV